MNEKADQEKVKALTAEIEKRLMRLLSHVDPQFMNECLDEAIKAQLENRSSDEEAAINKLTAEALRLAVERGEVKR